MQVLKENKILLTDSPKAQYSVEPCFSLSIFTSKYVFYRSFTVTRKWPFNKRWANSLVLRGTGFSKEMAE